MAKKGGYRAGTRKRSALPSNGSMQNNRGHPHRPHRFAISFGRKLRRLSVWGSVLLAGSARNELRASPKAGRL